MMVELLNQKRVAFEQTQICARLAVQRYSEFTKPN